MALDEASLGEVFQTEWSVDPQPVLEIGVLDGEDEYVLVNPVSVIGLHDGTVVIALHLRDLFELRYFDSQGTFLGKAGRHGEGPFEVSEMPTFIDKVPGDSILVITLDNRFSLFGPRGERVRSGRFSHGIPHPFSSHIDESHLGLTQVKPGRASEPRHEFVFSILDLSSGAVDTLETFSTPSRTQSGDGWVFSSPFPEEAYWAGGTGTFWRGTSMSRSIRGHSVEDGESVSIELDQSREPVTRRMRSRFREWQKRGVTGGRLRNMEEYHRRIEFPDSLPPYQDMKTDNAGNVWVLRYEPPWSEAEYVWEAYQPRGASIAKLKVPDGLLPNCVRHRSGGCPPGVNMYSIEDDYILTVDAKGEYQVPVVRKYRLIKG